MAFNRAAAKAAGYSDQEIEQYLATKKSSAPEPSLLQKAGNMGYNFLLKEPVDAVNTSVDRQMARPAPSSLSEALNPVNAAGSFYNDVVSPSIIPAIDTVSKIQMLRGLLNLGVSGAKWAGRVAMNPTKEMVANATTQAAEKGSSVPFSDIQNQAEQRVFKRYGNIPDVREALNKVLAPETSSGMESVPGSLDKSSSEILDMRRQIMNRIGSRNWLQKMIGGAPLEDKVAGDVRSVLSQLLHEAAPGTIPYDKLYGTYSKVGDVPQIAGRAALGAAAYLGLPKIAGPLVQHFFSGGN